MSERLSAQISKALPADWRKKYANVYVKTDKTGRDSIWGVEKKTGKSKRLKWIDLDKAVESSFGHSTRARKDYGTRAGPSNRSWDISYGDAYRASHGLSVSPNIASRPSSTPPSEFALGGLVKFINIQRPSWLSRSNKSQKTEASSPSGNSENIINDSPQQGAELSWRDRVLAPIQTSTGSAYVRALDVMYQRDKRGRVTREVINIKGEEEKKSRVGKVLGAIGLMGAGAVLFWLGTKYGHGGHNYSDQFNEIINQSKALKDQNQHMQEQFNSLSQHSRQGLQFMDSGHIQPGLHREYLGGVNNGFAVDLPRGADTGLNPDGTYHVTGADGKTWISSMGWDRQGNLGNEIRTDSLSGFHLKQDTLTYLDVDGPGKQGMVKHYVTAILGRK